MGEWTEKLPEDLRGDMPAFDALREYLNGGPNENAKVEKPPVLRWIDKLEEWCADRLTDGAADQKKKDDYSEQIDKLEEELSETRDSKIELESLLEEMADVERGLRTMEEVLDDRRRRFLV